jgi:hypothetical protein
LNNDIQEWQHKESEELICDTNRTIKEYDIAMGPDNMLFLLSNEVADSYNPIQKPKNGILFSKPDMSHVLRMIRINESLGIEDIDENDIISNVKNMPDSPISDISVSPNPASDIAKLQFNLSDNKNINIKLIDVSGREVLNISENYYNAGYNAIDINLTDLSSGAYYLIIETDDNRIIRNIIKVN